MPITLNTADIPAAQKAFAKAYVETLSPNATFPDVPSVARFLKYDLVKFVAFAAATGARLRVLGDAGIGKTSFLRAAVESLGYQMVYFNGPMLSAENLGIPMPVTATGEVGAVEQADGIAYLMREALVRDGAKIIVIDELNRANPGVASILMEVLQEGSIAGVKVPDLVTVISLENPQGGEYGSLVGMDHAQASRFVTLDLDGNATPWREALAAKFPKVDLTDVFATRDRFDPAVRKVVSPRVLEHMLLALTNGLAPEYALPAPNCEQVVLRDASGNERTDEVLDALAAALKVSRRPKDTARDLPRIFEVCAQNKANVHIIGKHGRGKTAGVKATLAQMGLRTVYKSAPPLNPEDLAIPFPVRRTDQDGCDRGEALETLLFQEFQGEPFVLVVDEPGRASRRTQNALMEVIQERSIDGKRIPLEFTVALNNPREVKYADGSSFKYDVGKTDLAQASRYAFTVVLGDDDFACGTHLFNVYGDAATPFIEWRQEDLSAEARDLVCFRTLEKMITLHLAEMDPMFALPYVGGEYAPVPLHDLKLRLRNAEPPRLGKMASDIDQWEATLRKGNELEPVAHTEVTAALLLAELAHLERYRPQVVRLMGALSSQGLLGILTGQKDPVRQTFLNKALMEARATAATAA